MIGEDIEIKVRPGGLQPIKADPTQIEQVLMNLCWYARDAMPEGGRLVIETGMTEVDDADARLAVAYGIVKQHGGFIRVYSDFGHGSVFRAYLPAFNGKIQKAEAAAVAPARPADPHGSEVILLAEDDESGREMVRQAPINFGYRVLSASNGEGALRLCETETPSLAILDVVMPRMGKPPQRSSCSRDF